MKRHAGQITALRWITEDFASQQLLSLNDGGWDKLKNDLRLWLFPASQNAGGTDYVTAFDRVSVGEAQRNVRGVLELIARRNALVLRNDPNEHPNNRQQEIYPLRIEDAHKEVRVPTESAKPLKWVRPTELNVVVEPDGAVWTFYSSIHLPSMVYLTLSNVLRYSGATDQILICDNRDCKRLFISKRKPRHDRKGHYCTYRCCHLESTRRYREAPREDPELYENIKAVERERIRDYYKPKTRKKTTKKN